MKHAHSVPAHAHASLVSPNLMSNAGIARSGGMMGKDVNNQQKIALAGMDACFWFLLYLFIFLMYFIHFQALISAHVKA